MESRLLDWFAGEEYGRMARLKRADMGKMEFKKVIGELPPLFEGSKPPAEEPRDILFPYLDGLFAGTDTDPTAINSLYDGMAIAFEKAIKTYKQSPP